MHDISAEVRLRPIRIALLVSPTDLPAIRKFMRICTCLWGGAYNPIIPVFRRRPKEWRLERSNALAVLHQSPDKRGVPLPVKMVSQLTQTWHSQVRSFC